MADFIPEDTFDGVRQIETADRALGGDMGSPINMSLQSLVNRTFYISTRIAMTPEVPLGSESSAGSQQYANQGQVQTTEDALPDDRILSPLRLDQLIAQFAAGTIDDADEDTSGLVELATLTEARAGTSNSVVPTVRGAREIIETFFGINISFGVWNVTAIKDDSDDYDLTPINSTYIQFGTVVYANFNFRIDPYSEGVNRDSSTYTLHSATPTIASGTPYGMGQSINYHITGTNIWKPAQSFSIASTTHSGNPALSLEATQTEALTSDPAPTNYRNECYCNIAYTTNA